MMHYLMINEYIMSALKIVSKILNEKKIPWMLIGSCNLAIQGMDLNPRDIDICVDKVNFNEIKRLFSNFGDIKIEEFPSSFGGTAFKLYFYIEKIEIEFLGEVTQSIYSKVLKDKGFIKQEFCGNIFNLNKLENEYQACFNMKRFEKASKIKTYLENLMSL